MSPQQLSDALKNSNLEDILGVPKMNLDYLMLQTGKSADEILDMLKSQGIDISKINPSNIDSLANLLKKPQQVHHFASNINSTYTNRFEKIINKYGLDLDGDWNKQALPHQGRHPNAYHDWVLHEMIEIDAIANGDVNLFLELFDKKVKEVVTNNPDMLYSNYWENLSK